MKKLFAVVVIALAAVGCVGRAVPETPAQIVYAAHGEYAAALPIAIQYKRLPTCGPDAPKVLCKDPLTFKKLLEADDEAFAKLSKAQAAVRAGDGTGGAVEATAARRAVDAFKKQTATLPKETK